MELLIIVASIPVGILGLALEHTLRVATARPEIAAIFLTLNGFLLLGAERLRRRSQVRELARRQGLDADGGRRLDTLEYREAAIIGTCNAVGVSSIRLADPASAAGTDASGGKP